MTRTLTRPSAALAAFGLLAVLFTTAMAQDTPRPAEEILKAYDAVEIPQFDRAQANDQAAVLKYIEARREAMTLRAELAEELYKAHPDHERVAEVLGERWTGLMMNGEVDQAIAQIDAVLADSKSDSLRAEAAFWKARIVMSTNRENPEAAMPAVEQFLELAPKDERAPMLLYSLASTLEDEAKKSALEDRIIKDFGDTMFGNMIQGERRRREQIGKPFELAFTDAVSGSEVSIEGLKGKVVVIDFWATWCGPCIAELPHMKELYTQYKDQGVEFIGVSLDQPEDEGGLTALKDFVKEREISWPQYYQGKGWESEFSGSWGINSIPALFVVDADGNLHSVEARGKLDTMIPELIAQRDAAKSGGE